MSYNVQLTDNFKKEAKKLVKKYASLKSELADLFKELAENPKTGIALGNGVYKIRLAIASKGKGKSGARVMTFVKVVTAAVLVFSIYDKGEIDSISDGDIEAFIKDHKK